MCGNLTSQSRILGILKTSNILYLTSEKDVISLLASAKSIFSSLAILRDVGPPASWSIQYVEGPDLLLDLRFGYFYTRFSTIAKFKVWVPETNLYSTLPRISLHLTLTT